MMTPLSELKKIVQGKPGSWFVSVGAAELRLLLCELEQRRTQVLQLNNALDYRDRLIEEHSRECETFDGRLRD